MSTIDKMLIKGIRSFSPDNSHVITFYRPLTLVVGANGAGKTTIIECLKNACTGELPPNARSGQSFIHDPKVAGHTETKGQIKLRFKTSAGKDVVCIRSFQLTQKASKMEYKAIESVLQTISPQTGEKVSCSYRCVDMDREVPALLGVSKAILENVIFVHQDEANWPLSEASVLKKKFDDIFSATRYTKALEVLKKLHKEQVHEIKTQKLKLENLQTLKDMALKLQENIRNDEEKAEQFRSKMQTLEQRISDSQRRIQSLEEIRYQIREVEKEIHTAEVKKTAAIARKNEIFDSLEEESEDTTEELEEWKVKFDEKMDSLKYDAEKLRRKHTETVNQVNFLSEDIPAANQTMGKLLGEEEAHNRQKQVFEKLIEELLMRYQLGSVTGTSFEDFDQCMKKLSKRMDDLNADCSQLKEFNKRELENRFKGVEEIRKTRSDNSGLILGKKQQKSDAESRISELNLLITDTSFIEEDLKEAREKSIKLENDLRQMEKKVAEKNLAAVIEDKRNERNALDSKYKIVRKEKENLEKESKERAELASKKEQATQQQRNLKRTLDDNKEKIRRVLKTQPREPKYLKKEVDQAYGKCSETCKELNKRIVDAEKKVSRVSSMLEEAQSSLTKSKAEKDAKKKLLASRLSSIFEKDVDIDVFHSQYQEAVQVKETKKSQHDMADGMRRMFDPFERIARASHLCPCCERGFSAEEEDEFVNKQRVKRASTAERLQDLASQYANADRLVQQLTKLSPIYDDYQKLVSKTIPEYEKQIQELLPEQQSSTEERDDVACLLAQTNTELQMINDIKETAGRVDYLCTDIEKLLKEVEQEEYMLKSQSHSLRSPEEVASELKDIEEKLEDLDRKIHRLSEEHLEMKDDLEAFRKRCHAENVKKLSIENSLSEQISLREQWKRASEDRDNLEIEIQSLTESLAPLNKEEERRTGDYKRFQMELEEQLNERVGEARELEKEVDKLSTMREAIKRYVDSGKTKLLRDVTRKIAEKKAQKEEAEKLLINLQAELENSNKIIQDQESIKRNLEDNLKYRKACAAEEQFEQMIDDLEKKKLSLGDISMLESNLRKCEAEKDSLQAEMNRNKGTISVYENNVARNRADLKQPQYKDIDKLYRSQLIQLKTTEMANKDLEKYYSALDRALMRFHTMKMEEINKIIKELWQQTYRGQDIDYIEIRADAEGVGTRSYSYRVVMRTGDAELEMRGRCSAGQKVLAALIIRLALAETFCLNCGILTLDEPTTNLDSHNAESFAAALVRIMEDRRGQENFQLIVITHDEKFAQLIGQRQLAEKYYRVSKDDHQHSVIEVQDIYS